MSTIRWAYKITEDESAVDHLGKLGWELVFVVCTQTQFEAVKYVFKRPRRQQRKKAA